MVSPSRFEDEPGRTAYVVLHAKIRILKRLRADADDLSRSSRLPDAGRPHRSHSLVSEPLG
jgi:hypothetical protein